MSDPAKPAAPAPAPNAGGPRPRYKRKLSNYLIDKKLQLRYVLVVTILSGIIAGSLGVMIYHQRHLASESIEKDLMALDDQVNDKQSEDLRHNIPAAMAAEDRNDALTMVGVGIGLAVILSGYLLIMTHKVAGPLFKVSMYFDRMAKGQLGKVTPLRSGDMLQDFYLSFAEMHDAVRARALEDNAALAAALDELKASKNLTDYRGDARAALDKELDQMTRHVDARKTALVDFPPRA